MRKAGPSVIGLGRQRGADSLVQPPELREAAETGLVSRLAGRTPEADLVELDAFVDRMEPPTALGNPRRGQVRRLDASGGAIREHFGNIPARLPTTAPQSPHTRHNERV